MTRFVPGNTIWWQGSFLGNAVWWQLAQEISSKLRLLGWKNFFENFHCGFRYQWVTLYNISKIFPRWHCPFNGPNILGPKKFGPNILAHKIYGPWNFLDWQDFAKKTLGLKDFWSNKFLGKEIQAQKDLCSKKFWSKKIWLRKILMYLNFKIGSITFGKMLISGYIADMDKCHRTNVAWTNVTTYMVKKYQDLPS